MLSIAADNGGKPTMAAPVSPDDSQLSRYPVRWHEGGMRGRPDEDVTLDAKGLRPGPPASGKRIEYKDILQVRLQSVPARGGDGSLLEIAATGGRIIAVTAAPGRDDSRVEAYREFVEDFHRRLGPGERANIRFIRGIAAEKHRMMRGSVVTVAAFAIVIPGAIFLATGWWPALSFALVAAPLIWTLARNAKENAPGTYDPDNLPAELLPD